MRTSHRVARNTLVLYAKTGVTMFFSLYTTRVVLRELGAEGFGVFALVGSVIAMLGFLNGSMSAATQRFMSYSHGKGEVDEQRDIFNISFAMHAVAGLLMVAILALIGPLLFAHVFKIDRVYIGATEIIYYCVAGGAFFSIIAVPYTAVLIARENIPYIALVSFFESLAKLLVAVAITKVGTDAKLVTYGMLMASIPLVLFLFFAIFCHLRYKECIFSAQFRHQHKLIKEMLRFGGWSFLGSFSSVVSRNGQGTVLNSFFGTTLNSAQGVTNQVSGQLGVLAGAFEKALNPVITKSEGAGNREAMLARMMTGCKVSFFLKAILLIPIILEIDFLFNLWLIEIPQYTITFCLIYFCNGLIDTYTMSLNQALSAVGTIKWYQISSAIIEPIPLIAAAFVFAAGSPPYALYVFFIVGSILKLGLLLIFCEKYCCLTPFDFLIEVTLKTIFPFSLVIAFGWGVHSLIENNSIRVVSSVGLALLLYLPLCYWFSLSHSERSKIRVAVALLKARFIS